MNNTFQENKRSFFLLLGLLFLLLIVGYFLLFQPISKELKTRENTQKALETDNQVLQVKLAKAENGSDEFDSEMYLLEKKLPLDEEIEQLILTLQEIELLSDIRLDNFSFSYGNNAPQREIEEAAEGETDTNAESETDEEESTSEQDNISFDGIPENLQSITVSFNVTAPNYEQYQEFINLIEEQERFMTVTNMTFQKPAERELLVDEENETITADVSVTTFYFNE
ncbi:hypothetical protein [Ornithinibacillus halotolerans]|uniref:Type IV pilus assembly protein PilO n=1 Tax=Ornithinibacillus halotolerans TaxID=1274357 RepID=A0A916WAR9_9BACI|nr:hypothetical protein [Ornithinibacillus halotolerans]GGA82070.1 hypothetical protein GCM10008025_26640 [Ornithinibacillus halotolerans]